MDGEKVAGDAGENGRCQKPAGPSFEQSGSKQAEYSDEPGKYADQAQRDVEKGEYCQNHGVSFVLS